MKIRKTKRVWIALVFIAIASVHGLILFEKRLGFLGEMDNGILLLLLVLLIISVELYFKIRRKPKVIVEPDDELSIRNKYKSGYYSYFLSLVIWLFIISNEYKFPNTQAMLAGGFILSVIFGFVTRVVIRWETYDEQN